MKRPPRAVAFCLLTLACALAALGLAELRFFRTLELKTLDQRFRLLGDQGVASPDIVLVAIDDASLKTLEPAVGRWPWPRDAHSVLLDYLERAGARLVVFDLLFTERDATDPEADVTFGEAVAAAGNTIQAIYLSRQDTGPTDLGLLERASIPFDGGFDSFADLQFPIPAIAAGATGLGHVTAVLDADGPWRRYLLLAGHSGRLVPSLALSAALAVRGLSAAELEIGERSVGIGGATARLDHDWRLPIWFNGGPGTYPRYSYGQLFYSELQLVEGGEPGLDPELFRGKIVVVGLAAAGLHDLFTTPYSGGAEESGAGLGGMDGAEIHANVLDDLLSGRFLRLAPAWLTLLVPVAAAAAAVALALFSPLPTAVAGIVALPVIWLGLAIAGFARQWQLPITPVLLAWGLATAVGFAYQYGVESAERRKVGKIFSRYVSPDVYRELIANPAAADLGGSRRDMTVLFSDLRGFTTFSEGRPPEEVVRQLNEYFTAMVEVVLAHRGTVDKFVGDMIMALFGAPVEDPEHAGNAVACAIAMQRRLAALNRGWRAEGRPELKSGIGINSGDMVVGNLGSERVQSYTVIGDNVNLGSRIESLCKEYAAEILISEFTRGRLATSLEAEPLGEVVVKGKTKPVAIFRVPLATEPPSG